MSNVQFTALIRFPFNRGNFVDPPQAQWDAEKDRQLWKVISKSSKTSDLDWVDMAARFQVPPAFLLQQAAWLYERHLDHVRNQMKKVTLSSVNASTTPTSASALTSGGVAMQRTGSGGVTMQRTGSASSRGPRITPALPWQQSRGSPSLRGGEIVPTITPSAPALSRTPSTTTITQSRAHAQQAPSRNTSTRSVRRPNLHSPKPEDKPSSLNATPSGLRRVSIDSPDVPASPSASSSSTSSSSDADHPAHRSQLFKRPPRFKPQRTRDLSTFAEGDGTDDTNDSGLHGTSLPFASAVSRRTMNTKYTQDTMYHTGAESKVHSDRTRNLQAVRHPLADQQSLTTLETSSSITSSASASDVPTSVKAAGKVPATQPSNHRTGLGRLGSPRQRTKIEGSEGTPSMGSSFSDIDDAGISQSALEEALLSNMQHGRMSTLSRMSRFI